MTRIVHVMRSDGFAGVEGFVARLALEQFRQAHQVAVIGGDPTRMRAVLGPDISHTPAASVIDASRAVRAALTAGEPPEVIHVHMTAAELSTSLALGPRPRALAPAVVSTCHFASARGAGSGLAGPLVAALARRRIDAQIAVSAFVATAVGGRTPTQVVHTGVPNRDRATESRDRLVLLAQRLEPEKHTDDALRIFAQSQVARRGWRLIVAGDGSARGSLLSLAADLGIADAVDLLGRRDDVGALMDRAGILLAPTPREGLGLAVLEAMSCGLPVLAAGSGGHLETVGSVPGAQLYADLADGASRLRAMVDDERGRAAYGADLHRAQRERFTIERQVAQTDAVYRRVLEGHR
ncbi:MAG: glycosyltransferase family 4 protein [Actinomycetales bacterium]|nr:glycosyltransferase family 4 protein [Candidatus Phosphoribacter baldrii]